MKIFTGYLTDPGGKKKNDDTVRILQEHQHTYIFVGDGLGGYEGGKIASETAAEAILEFGKTESLLEEENLHKAAQIADEAVKNRQSLLHGRMKTTMVLLVLEGERARWMHVGDSRLYHFREGRLKSQTMDHSVSQVAVLMGEISPQEIRFHEDRNRVLRALGSDNAKPDISSVMDICEGDAFLLCTDGFWEYVYENEMEEVLQNSKNPQEWIEHMQKLLKNRVPKEHDNFSAAAVFCSADFHG